MLLEQIVTKAAIVNGQPQPDDLLLTVTVLTWHEVLEDVPDDTLLDVYKMAIKAKRDTYPLKVLDLKLAWETRYTEVLGPPPPGYSWARDSNGSFKPLGEDPKTGLWPFGGRTIEEERQFYLAWCASTDGQRQQALAQINSSALQSQLPEGADNKEELLEW